MELIVISSPSPVSGEARLINQLFQAGMQRFHLRKPDSDYATIRKLLSEIGSSFQERIALHQFQEIAPDFGIKRLHYPEAARRATPLQTLQKQREAGFTLSTSIHQVSSFKGLQHFDYTFYGPVFDSISKTGYTGKVPEDFIWSKADQQTRVIALGGVDARNLGKLRQRGFDGVAVLGTLWNDPQHAVERFKQLKEQSCEYP
jgi:thiamine-phosphate pyrophosphorylase